MSPREPKTMEERMLLVEYKQEQQEDDMRLLRSEMIDVKETSAEAKDAAIQVGNQMALLPGKVIEAIENKKEKRKIDVREWGSFAILVIVSALSVVDRFF